MLRRMDSSDGHRVAWDSGEGANVRAEALDVVLDALQWHLVHARWDLVQQVLKAMNAALAAGDQEALAAATADLELAGPLRITMIGATPVVPPTPPVRDLLNHLVHALGDTPKGGHDGPDDTGADRDGVTRR